MAHVSRPAAPRAPWSDAVRNLPGPLAVVDLEAFDANAADLVARAGGTPVRLATKSVRVRSLIDRGLAREGFAGTMTFHLDEALWLVAHGVTDDALMGYPTVDAGALRRLVADPAARAAVTLMVDDVAQLALVERALMRGAPDGPPVQVCLDVDAGLRLGPVHVGPRRSPLRSPQDVAALARAAERSGRIRVRGVMFYEGQVAGVPETGPRAPAVRAIKALSMAQLARRRGAVVTALEEALGRADLLVNGGGSGSVQGTVADATVTEVTAGSGLFVPTLFDHYHSFTPRPAAFFGLDVVRRPGPGYATAYAGGYVASGAVGADRWPTPLTGRLTGLEGAGEVQTPLRYPRGQEPPIGGRVWLRHAKAGEMMERFAQAHLVRGADLVATVPTYRGEGRTFG